MTEQHIRLSEHRLWPPAGLPLLSVFGGGRLAAEFRSIAEKIADEVRVREIATAQGPHEPVPRVDYSTRQMPGGSLSLRRFYWSVQRRLSAGSVVKSQRDHGATISADVMIEDCEAAGHAGIGRKVLFWHLACAELHHLQQLFKKGRAAEELALLALARIQSSCLECPP